MSDVMTAEIVGVSRGCDGCQTLRGILEGVRDLGALDISPDDFPEEVEDMVEIACGLCGDSVQCERVGSVFEISIAKRMNQS